MSKIPSEVDKHYFLGRCLFTLPFPLRSWECPPSIVWGDKWGCLLGGVWELSIDWTTGTGWGSSFPSPMIWGGSPVRCFRFCQCMLWQPSSMLLSSRCVDGTTTSAAAWPAAGGEGASNSKRGVVLMAAEEPKKHSTHR